MPTVTIQQRCKKWIQCPFNLSEKWYCPQLTRRQKSNNCYYAVDSVDASVCDSNKQCICHLNGKSVIDFRQQAKSLLASSNVPWHDKSLQKTLKDNIHSAWTSTWDLLCVRCQDNIIIAFLDHLKATHLYIWFSDKSKNLKPNICFSWRMHKIRLQ